MSVMFLSLRLDQGKGILLNYNLPCDSGKNKRVGRKRETRIWRKYYNKIAGLDRRKVTVSQQVTRTVC